MVSEDWARIQPALGKAFAGGPDGAVGGNFLAQVMKEEGEYGFALVQFYKGYDVLEHSFFEFFIETLKLAGESAFFGQLPKEDKCYTHLFLTFFSVFRNFRAAAILKNNGYPMKGYSLLRDLKDRAFHLGAVVNKQVDVLSLYGLDPTQEEDKKLDDADYEKIRAVRKKAQKHAIKFMVGSDSGLDAEVIEELEKWRDMFHEEVHGSKFSFLEDFRTIFVSKKLPEFGPRPHKENYDASMYLNRSVEIGWMFLRTMPVLQLKEGSFGDEWIEKWQLLDEAFGAQVDGLAHIGKKIGDIFPRMMDAKFPFDPETHYQPDA